MAAGEEEASSGYWQLKQCKYTCIFIEKVIFTVRKQLKLFLYDCSIFFSLGRLSQPSTEPSLLGLGFTIVVENVDKVRIFCTKRLV